MRKWAAMSGVLGAVALSASSANADTASDRASSILVFPRVVAQRLFFPVRAPNTQIGLTVDTVIQISNTSNDPVQLKCFYVNANSHCSTTESVCNAPDFFNSSRCLLPDEVCQPGWSETDFHVTLTAQQPLAWRASRGLQADDVPLDGTSIQGPGGQSNAGTRVPPVATEPLFPALLNPPPDLIAEAFVGELKCIVVDDQGTAIARNVIKGEATTETLQELGTQPLPPGVPTLLELSGTDKYSAVGIQGIGGDANGDRVLELGGDAGEYNGCPNVLIVDHFFDSEVPIHLPVLASEVLASAVDGQLVENAALDISETSAPQITDRGFFSSLTLVPCTQDLQAQIPGRVVAQYLVFNEFEQRFSTSTPIECFFEEQLSNIDTPQNDRSIFSAAVAGTVSGQTRIRGVGGGLIGILREHLGATRFLLPVSSAASNLHIQGERADADRIVIPER